MIQGKEPSMPLNDAQKRANEAHNQLIAEGKFIEGGFAAFQIIVIPEDAPPDQLRDMRMAFFAGAQYLFTTIMTKGEPGAEWPSPADFKKKMDQIHDEFTTFTVSVERRDEMRTGRFN
jgi:hypothetical protein